MQREKDLNKIREHWENPETISLKDEDLQILERNTLLYYLRQHSPLERLADIGCGDGTDTRFWAPFAQQVIGYDYAETMLAKANINSQPNLRYKKLDLLASTPDGNFDAVITKRCLINLGSFVLSVSKHWTN